MNDGNLSQCICKSNTISVDIDLFDGYVYANPVNDILNIINMDGEGDLLGSAFEIYNISGQLIENGLLINFKDRIAIDVSRLQSGYYILKLISENGNLINEFIKN